eukprot:symbB.v1.2.012594.t1/scaffold820.1/size171332/1
MSLSNEPQYRAAFQRLSEGATVLSRQVLQDIVQAGPDVPQAELEDFQAGLPEEFTFEDFLDLMGAESRP